MAQIVLDEIVEHKIPPHFRERCTSRVLAAKAGISNESKNPRIQLDCEIVKPETVQGNDGITYVTDGLKFTIYVPTKDISDDIKDAKAKSNFKSLVKALELEEAYATFDDENPNPRHFEGIVFENIVTAQEDKPQRRNEKGEYVPLTDGEGKPISRGWTINMQAARDVLCRSTVEVNRPY